MITKPHVLIVDDEPGIRESLASILQDEGYLVDAVGSAEEALERVSSGELELILLDVWLPGMDGLEALSRIQIRHASARGHHDFRPRHHRNRRARHQARSFRFHRKTSFPRKNYSARAQRHPAAPPGRRKPDPAQSARPPLSGHRRQHPHEGAAPADRRHRAHQRPRPRFTAKAAPARNSWPTRSTPPASAPKAPSWK